MYLRRCILDPVAVRPRLLRWRCAQDCSVKNVGSLADGYAAINVNSGFQHHAFCNFGTGIYKAPGADNGCVVNFGRRVYECGGVNHGREYS